MVASSRAARLAPRSSQSAQSRAQSSGQGLPPLQQSSSRRGAARRSMGASSCRRLGVLRGDRAERREFQRRQSALRVPARVLPKELGVTDVTTKVIEMVPVMTAWRSLGALPPWPPGVVWRGRPGSRCSRCCGAGGASLRCSCRSLRWQGRGSMGVGSSAGRASSTRALRSSGGVLRCLPSCPPTP